jgi:hypothetical protein
MTRIQEAGDTAWMDITGGSGFGAGTNSLELGNGSCCLDMDAGDGLSTIPPDRGGPMRMIRPYMLTA